MTRFGWFVAIALGALVPSLLAQQPATADAVQAPEGLVRLAPDYEIWLDKKNKRVVLVGEICQREGQMEMFACPRKTKEHEAVVSLATQAYMVHAALVALGAEPGNPAQFVPEYKPAQGPEIEVTVYWTDAQGKRQQTRAQNWLRNTRTNKEMATPWVFGGSGFWVDPQTREKHYLAEDGDLICVSNFTSATLDLPVESTQSNSSLMFEAWTERIPEKKTRVTLTLTPKLKGLDDQRGEDPKTDLLPPPKVDKPKDGRE
ncbi:MAG: hypothetical protein JSS27_13030 [Planctomycetes bacterium]|nr:hypothetical protein [Planctomycetota bacterium]